MSRITWREVFKFLSGVTFAGSIASFYLYMYNVSVPFLGYTVSPKLIGAKAALHLLLFTVFFYYGYVKK
jgi:hypothetical protein